MKRLVIIPTYNEIENIEAMVDKVLSLEPLISLLVIDDGSPDGTAAVVKRKQIDNPDRVHLIEREGKMGLGTAYIAGFRWALDNNFDIISEMDCDFSHNPNDLPKIMEACQNGSDLAVGSRYITGVNVVNWPIGRVIMSYYASAYVRTVLGIKVRDCTAGFVCYRAQMLRKIDLAGIQMKGYGFQIEMKYTAIKLGAKVIEIPIVFTDRTEGTSKMSGSIFGEAFWGVLKLKLRKITPAK